MSSDFLHVTLRAQAKKGKIDEPHFTKMLQSGL